jgi:DNA repair photolyase
MVPPIVHEIECRSALNPVRNMPFRWSLNPYKGCAHGCGYCYARAYHRYLDLSPSTFETQLFVKTNIARVLRAELAQGVGGGEPIAIGTGTDPYQPLEGQYRLTRRCLEALLEFQNPCSITTKGTLISRDLDLLVELDRQVDLTVHLSLITLDRELARELEPGAPAPSSRLKTIERLSDAGLSVAVFLAPVLPGLTDSPERLKAVVCAAAEHGAREVWSGALRLGPGVKEHFLSVVQEHFPQLVDGYQRMYGSGANAPTGYQVRLESQVAALRRQHDLPGMVHRMREAGIPRRGQLALPI